MIDWSQCEDVERTADTLGGAWRVRGTRIPVQAILDNAEAATPEEIAREIYSLDVDAVRRILAFAGVTPFDYPDNPPPLFGEDWLTALLLAMVDDHCGYHSPEKERQLQAGQGTYLSRDPSPDRWLNSYNNPDNAAAMRELDGCEIEIVEQDGAHILAKLTPEGRALLDRLRIQQQRDRQRGAKP